MNKMLAITFPPTGGVFAMGPYLAGKTYVVPEDIGQHLLLRGAEAVDPAKVKETQPLEGRHHEHFKTVRAFVEAEKAAATQAAADKAAAEKASTAAAADAVVAVDKAAPAIATEK